MNGKMIGRMSAYGVVVLAAIGGVWFATRQKGEEPMPASGGHNHGTAAATDSAHPVALSAADAQRIGVTYATVSVGALSREIRSVGQVTFDETRVQTITPKIDGYVDRLLVNATGQYVAAGQALLDIYSPMLVTAQEELLLAARLQKDVAGASEQTRRNADNLLTAARRRLAYWDIGDEVVAEIERTGTVRKTLTLRSPVGGYVLEKNVLAGQKIMAGEALYKVADLSTVWVEGEVFEQDLAAVRLGQVVRAEFQALPGDVRRGEIAYVYPTVSTETRTARVRVVVPNGDLHLKPGMYATIRIGGTARQGVLTVPRSAVLTTGERSLVFVRDANGHLEPREVSVGASADDRIEILRGVKAGDVVVASATFLVDAESNLGKALGGMGDMPGMDMTTPPKLLPPKER